MNLERKKGSINGFLIIKRMRNLEAQECLIEKWEYRGYINGIITQKRLIFFFVLLILCFGLIWWGFGLIMIE